MAFAQLVCIVFVSFMNFTSVASAAPTNKSSKHLLNCPGPNCDTYGYDTDGGNDPLVPGCLLISDEPTCSTTTRTQFDHCEDNSDVNLVEVESDATCTKNPLLSTHAIDCNEWCMKEYSQEGRCHSSIITACGDVNVGFCICGDRR